jgi:SAM-dependent methyltransferase
MRMPATGTPTAGTSAWSKYTLGERRRRAKHARPSAVRAAARAYDYVSEDYGLYADGEGLEKPTRGGNRFAHADAIVWEVIRKAIDDVRSAGVTTLRVLDAGCGPGTWIKRIAAHACRLGLGVQATGFDISQEQLDIARKRVQGVSTVRAGANRIQWLVHDLANPLPWSTGHFHVVLCNYIVLNHLHRSELPEAIVELCRVASGRVIATVRALASPATGCIIGTEQVSEYHQDCRRGELRLVLKDGSEHFLTLNLYTAEMLKALFSAHAVIRDLRAVDLFVSRFAGDANWTGSLLETLPGREHVMRTLRQAEENLCRKPAWIDHGTYVLVVAQPRPRRARHLARSQVTTAA